MTATDGSIVVLTGGVTDGRTAGGSKMNVVLTGGVTDGTTIGGSIVVVVKIDTDTGTVPDE